MLGRWVRAAVPVLVPLGLLLAALEILSISSSPDDFRLSGWTVAVVAAMVVTGQVLLGLSWDWLFPAITDHSALAWSFHGSQPAKYVPIGVAQPLGQIGLLRHSGPEAAEGAVVWVSHVIVVAAAGLFVGSSVAVGSGVPPWIRLAGFGVFAPLAVYRPIQNHLLATVRRVIRRVPEPTVVPPQRALLASFGTALVALALHSVAFALLTDGSVVRVAPAYALSFSLSLLTPLPAGLGVREALIVSTTGLSPAVALSAALVFRLVLIGSEVALFLLAGVLFRSTRGGRTSPGDGRV